MRYSSILRCPEPSTSIRRTVEVLPRMANGDPVTVTIVSPPLRCPARNNDSTAAATVSLERERSSTRHPRTPGRRVVLRSARGLSVIATMGIGGRCAAINRTALPCWVATSKRLACTSAARPAAAPVMARVLLKSASAGGEGRWFTATAARSAMRTMVSTALTGCFPEAVSPESMTALVNCRMAVATSLTSARVGRGWSTMDSSICVATMTGRPCCKQRSTIRS